jgi:hypothetical protein
MTKLIELEKYSTGKNKKTYIMIPSNHPKYLFPLNLEDRTDFIKNKVSSILNKKINFKQNINDKNKTITLSFVLDKKPTADDIYKLENIYEKYSLNNNIKMWTVSSDKLKWSTIVE